VHGVEAQEGVPGRRDAWVSSCSGWKSNLPRVIILRAQHAELHVFSHASWRLTLGRSWPWEWSLDVSDLSSAAQRLARHPGIHPAIRRSIRAHPRFGACRDEVMRYVMGRIGDSSPEENVVVAVGVCCALGLHQGPSFAEELAADVRSWFRRVRLTHRESSFWPSRCREGRCPECLQGEGVRNRTS
jgi:hypothetical protein